MSFPPNNQQQKRHVKVVELESDTDSDEIEVVDCVAGSGDGVPFRRELDLEIIEDFGAGSRMRMNVGREVPEIEFIEEVAGRPRQEPIRVYVVDSSEEEEDEIDVVGTPRIRASTPEAEVEPQLSHSIQVGNDGLQQQEVAGQPVDVAEVSGNVHDSDEEEDNQADHHINEQLRLEAQSDEKIKANETMNSLKGCHSDKNVTSQGSHTQPSTSGSSSQSSLRMANFDAKSGVSSLFRVATEAECDESLEWWKLELEDEPDPERVPTPDEQISINDFRDAFLAAVLKVDKEFAEEEKRMSASKQKKKR